MVRRVLEKGLFLFLVWLLVYGAAAEAYSPGLTEDEAREAVKFGASYSGYLFLIRDEWLESNRAAFFEEYGSLMLSVYEMKHTWEAFYRLTSQEWGPVRSYDFLYPFQNFDVNVKSLQVEAVVLTPFLQVATGAAGVSRLLDPDKGMIGRRFDLETKERIEPNKKEISSDVMEQIMESALRWGPRYSFYRDYLFIVLYVHGRRDYFPTEFRVLMRYEQDLIEPLHVTFRETYRSSELVIARLYYLVFPREYGPNKVIAENETIRIDVNCDNSLTHSLFFDLSKMR